MDEGQSISQRIKNSSLTRRSFLKWSAALGGATALGSAALPGFKELSSTAIAAADPQGKWIPAACWVDCGSRGFNSAYVVDNVVVRMKTDDTIQDSADTPQLRSCGRGRAQRNYLLSAERLKYPMKRKHWAPGGGDKSLRGKDEWVRISWDEALTIVANELIRIKGKYGNEGILANWAGTAIGRALGLFGGFIDEWGAYSGGVWLSPSRFNGFPAEFNDRMDLRSAQLFVLWGSNTAWSRAGVATYQYLQAKKAGAKFISIDPLYNNTAQALVDEWIPIRPATDHALILGMAHTLLTEDDPLSNPLIDWDFLNRCTVGFDKDHMPKGADPNENFKDYVLGAYDGQPKNAEWASEICGVPPDRIRRLAREIAQTERVAICLSTSSARVHNADSFPPAVLAFGAMTGHIGKPGSCVGQDGGHARIANGGPALATGGGAANSFTHPFTRAPQVTNPLAGDLLAGGFYSAKPAKPNILLTQTETWTAVLDGKYTAGYKDIRPLNIQMMYHGQGSRITQQPDTMKAMAAHRKVEFVVTQNLFFNPDAQYSDVVLPVTSRWERYGFVVPGYREYMLWTSQVMQPYFESQDDIWIAKELGKRLGLDPAKIEPWSLKQEIFNEIADVTVVKDDGVTYEPLVTVTEADLKEFGIEGKPQQGRIPIKEFKEKGIYQVPRKPNDKLGYIALKAFRDDPVKNALKTASGKLEIHCQPYADFIKSNGWTEIRPIPTYDPPIEGYEATFKDWKNKIKGDFPLQKFDLHFLRRAHSNFANTPWLREAFSREFFMNPNDAAERGIADGDTVLVESRHGKVLRLVSVTNRIIPGAVAIGQGSWFDYDEQNGVDRGGCANTLSGAIPTGQGHKGWNSCNVQVSKWTGTPLEADYKWSPKIPVKDGTV